MPHHEECWRENGGCTTFGCQGHASLSPPAQGTVSNYEARYPLRPSLPQGTSLRSRPGPSRLPWVVLVVVVVLLATAGAVVAVVLTGEDTGGTGASAEPAARSDDGLPDGAVAQVGEAYITQEQLDARVADFALQYQGSVPDAATDPEGYKEFTADVLDYMITLEVVKQKADDLQISVTDEDVQTEIDTILNETFGGDQAQFDAALESSNLTVDQLKASYKESMLLQAAYDEVTKDVTTVPDEEMAAYYEENKADYLMDDSRVARHILIAPGGLGDGGAATDADWAAALAEAEEVREELVNGGDWTEEAAQYSDDTGTKDIGGELGTVSKGQMVPEFEESVFSLAKDEISQPVKTAYGYHVIQVTDISEAKQYTLDEVKEDISSILLSEKKAEAWEQWLEGTKTELNIVFKEGLEPTMTTDASTSATESGFVPSNGQ